VHDPVYKLIFSEPRMVEDLLRAFVPGTWTDTLDFSSLDKQPAEYVGENLRRRLGDMLWRVRFRTPAPGSGARELLVMLEFQSSSDPDMAVRILAYAGLVHQQSVRTGTLDAHGALPPVLPIVLYNGESRWTAASEAGELVAAVDAALARYQPSQRYLLLDEGALGDEDLPPDNRMSALVALENSASVEELLGVLREVFARFGGPEDEGLRGALYEWARHSPMTGRGEALPSRRELEGSEMATLQEARAREWRARVLREGREQGIELGVARGIAQGRVDLLRHLAMRKFGALVAERFDAMLDGLDDPEQLAEIGDWLIECDAADALLQRMERLRSGG